MAHTIAITKLIDGPRNAIFHIFIKHDGVSSDLVDYVIIDPGADFSPALPRIPNIRIEKIWSSLSGNFNLRFEYDDLVDKPIWTLDSTSDGIFDFNEFGGLLDRSGLDGTGKLQITTQNFNDATMQASMVIRVRKN